MGTITNRNFKCSETSEDPPKQVLPLPNTQSQSERKKQSKIVLGILLHCSSFISAKQHCARAKQSSSDLQHKLPCYVSCLFQCSVRPQENTCCSLLAELGSVVLGATYPAHFREALNSPLPDMGLGAAKGNLCRRSSL